MSSSCRSIFIQCVFEFVRQQRMKPIRRQNRQLRVRHKDEPFESPALPLTTCSSYVSRLHGASCDEKLVFARTVVIPSAILMLISCCFLTSCQLFSVPVVTASRIDSNSSANMQTIHESSNNAAILLSRRRHQPQESSDYLNRPLSYEDGDGAYNYYDHLQPQQITRNVRQATGTDQQQQRPSLVIDTRSPYHVNSNADRESYYKDVSAGDEFSITCFGQRPIRWTYPDSLANDRRLEILHPSSAGGPRGRIQSTLTVQDAQASDTGLYSCFYSDTYNNNNDNDVSSNSGADNDSTKVKVFIFVNDWDNLFVEPKNYIASRGAMITLSQGEPGIIPCVPTFSNATVTLVQVHHAGHEVQIPLQNSDSDSGGGPASDFQYAPTRGGIIIPFPSKPMVGQYRCRAQVRGLNSNRPVTEELNVRALNFVVQGKPPHPVIDRSRARHVIEAGSFSLSCYVNLPLTKEPITLEWTAPSREAQRKLRQTAIMDTTKRSASLADLEYLEVRRNFTLDNVNRITDAGPYECRITKNGQTRRAAVDISPYAASEKTHIYVKPENPVEIINFTTPVSAFAHQPFPAPGGGGGRLDRKKGSTKFLSKFVVFRAALDVYPQPPRSVYWVRNGNRIKPHDEKYNITHLPNNEYSFLRINDIDGPQDAGVYTLWVETNDKRQSADFELKINVVPTVELYGATDSRAAYVKEARDDYNVVLHTVGAMPHVLTCVANGNPIPTIEWRWQECPYDTCNPARRENWHHMKPQAYTIVPDYITSTVASNLSIAATRPTWYQCRARNSVGSGNDGYMSSDVLSIPSDIVSHKNMNPVDDQFEMLPHDPVEGDDVTLTCRASKILFERIAIEHFAPGIRESRVQRRTFDTEYAFVQSVTINDIGRDDGGFYECILYPTTWLLDSREPKKRRLEMSIEDQTSPYMHRYEPADPVVNAVYDKRQDLQCVARGKPHPQYTWYKDGKELKRTDDAHRYEDDGQVLVLPRVVEEDSGVYECVARNRVGEARHDWSIIVTGDPSGSNAMTSQKKHLIVLISVSVGIGFLIMLTCLLYACTKWRKEKRLRKRLQHLERLLKTKGDLERLDPTVALSNQAELLEFKEQFEFPRDKLRLLDVLLGSGKFGKVVLGEAQGIAAFSMATDGKKSTRAAKNPQLQQRWVRVAVKIARDHGDVEQLKMLMAELKVHMFVGHHLNVVNLLAAVTKNFQLGEMFVILEYCGNGSLKKFLLRHRTELNFLNQVTPSGELKKLDTEVLEAKRQALAVSLLHDDAGAGSQQAVDGTVLTTNDLLSFAYQLACGMAYLADRRVIHRDLAARNVLLTDNLVVKICDFGLAREGVNNEQDGDAEYSRSLLKEYNNEPLPVKWVAPECVSESRFSTASDVWSYGITLWEIFSLGGDPYPDDKPSREFLDKIFAGYRMQRPAFSPRQMFTVMQLCWDIDPQQRPNFVQLQQLVSKMMNDDELDKYQIMQTQEPYQYMHLMTSPSATNGSEEAWPLIPADAHAADHRNGTTAAAARTFMEQTPDDSSDSGYRRDEQSARRVPPHRTSPPTTASTVYAGDAHYRPGTSITSLGSSIAAHPTAVIGRRAPGAFTYLPSPSSSSTNSRQPYLGTSALMSRFGRTSTPATSFKPGGVLETDLDASGDNIEMNSMSRNNIGRDSRRPLLPDNDDGYLNEEFSPAAMSPVFGGAASGFNNVSNLRSTSSFKSGGPSSVSSMTTTTTIPNIPSSNSNRVTSPTRR